MATSCGTTSASSSRRAQDGSSSRPVRLRTVSPGKRSTKPSRRWCAAKPGMPPSSHTASWGSRTSSPSSTRKKCSSTSSTVAGTCTGMGLGGVSRCAGSSRPSSRATTASTMRCSSTCSG